MVICLERGADLHMAQRIPLPLTVSCFSKIQIGFTFLVPAHPGSLGQSAVKRLCVLVQIVWYLWDCCKVDPCYLPLTPSIMNVLSLCKCARKILYANINKQQFGHSIIFCVVTVNYWNWDVFKPCLFRVVHFLLHNLPRLEYKGRDEIFAAVLILWMMLYWLLMLMWLKITDLSDRIRQCWLLSANFHVCCPHV